ncbi:MAG: ABC transporter permease [Rhodobacteraceae bacterium]|nr:ABC transporter permease [Paracoccaceae bacterium]
MSYIAQRLYHGFIVLFAAASISFVLMFIIGDPVLMRIGDDATQETIDRVRQQMGLDRPLIVQYGQFMWGVVQGDFGLSYRHQEPVLGLLISRLGNSIILAVPALLLAICVSIPVGVISAMHRNRPIDFIARTFALVGQAAPNFWVGIMLILLFAIHLRWLPASGMGGETLGEKLKYMIMPVFTLSLLTMAYLTRMMRGAVLELMGQDFVRTARAKGLSPRRVMYRHVVRNAMLPYVTISGLQLGSLISGSMVVESVFSWPGFGRFLLDSIRLMDIPVVAGALTLVAVMYVVLAFIVDVIYTLLDPRLRRS